MTKHSDNAGETETHDQHVLHLKISTNNSFIPVVIGKQQSWKAGQSPPSPAKLLSDNMENHTYCVSFTLKNFYTPQRMHPGCRTLYVTNPLPYS